jgi:hypothetical protein
MIGINFMDCLLEDFSAYFDKIYECKLFRNILLLNFFFRLNFYALKRLDVFNKQMKRKIIFSKIQSLSHSLIKIVLPISLLLYIYFTLSEGVLNIYKIAILNFVVVLFGWIVFVRISTKDEDNYYLKSALIFKAYCMFHIFVTIGDYLFNYVVFYM